MLKAQIYNLIAFQSSAEGEEQKAKRNNGQKALSRFRLVPLNWRCKMDAGITITTIKPGDVDVLQALALRIFYHSFAALNTDANMKAYTDMAYNRELLLTEINDPRSEHYFLCDEEKKIGFLKLNTGEAQSDIRDPEGLEIQRIYIDQDYQGRGLGAQLLQFTSERAKALGLKYIWLGVWEKNPDAIRFYQRHGYEIFGSHPFVMGDEDQTDILMKNLL